MRRFVLTLILSSTCFFTIHAQSMDVRNQYIKKYKDIAIAEMSRTGIPASITLAQGIYESASGTSRLATEANNHFGIKCHDWTGATISHDDDAQGECFRVYDNPEASYRDHSDFLVNRPRYASLFNYSSTDYVNWAHGLKKAGYATNPQYAERLIKIIEESQLHIYDDPKNARINALSPIANVSKQSSRYRTDIYDQNKYTVYQVNGVNLILAKTGDTFGSIATLFATTPKALASFNDLPKDYELFEGQWIYLEKKKNKAEKGNYYHLVTAQQTYYDIAQLYGIKLKSLYKLNGLPIDSQEPQINTTLRIRRSK